LADVIENYFELEFHAMVRFSQAEEVHQTEIHCRLVSVYRQNVFSQEEVSVCFKTFKDNIMALKDDPEKQADQGPRALMEIVSLSTV
jgi:hypothetical protein